MVHAHEQRVTLPPGRGDREVVAGWIRILARRGYSDCARWLPECAFDDALDYAPAVFRALCSGIAVAVPGAIAFPFPHAAEQWNLASNRACANELCRTRKICLQRCVGCGEAFFCSDACLIRCWPRHWQECIADFAAVPLLARAEAGRVAYPVVTYDEID